MKAIISTQYGSPDVLQIRDVEQPVPTDNEVLVKIYATTVNRTDTATLRAIPFFARLFTGLLKPKQPILGSEFSGEIAAIGKKVTSFKVGDRVFGFNEDSFGSHAQYMTIAQDEALATIPENIGYEQAAASCEGAHYAYNFINKVAIKSGQSVLVNGATGAIGSAAVQLLKYFDVHVTAVCNTQNIALVKSLGADEIIDFTQQDFTKSDNKYHFVFDTVGKSSFFKCKPLLQSGGVYISSDLGYLSQNIFLPLVTPILKPMIGNKKTISPFPFAPRRSVLLVKKLIEEGKFQSVIDREYPLQQIVEAYKYVETGQKTGNVVITVAHDGVQPVS